MAARTVRDAVEQLEVVVDVVELVQPVEEGQDGEDDHELEPLRVVPAHATEVAEDAQCEPIEAEGAAAVEEEAEAAPVV